MIQVFINPTNKTAEILENLNICFPNWGNQETYNWYFNRTLNSFKPDIILFKNQESETIAGSALSYREIKMGQSTFLIGIMTGSWTLPNARGMGCFSKIIEVSKTLCLEKGVHFLTAFVTEDNASYRRLKDAGAFCLPANNYFFESNDTIPNKNPFHWVDMSEIEKLKEQFQNYFSNKNGFYYDFQSFQKQYLQRLNETKIFQHNNILYVIEISKIIKVLFVSEINLDELKSVFLHLHKFFDKKIMWFCSDYEIITSNLNFLESKSGFFTMIKVAETEWNLQRHFEKNKQLFEIQLGDKV